MTGLPIDRGVAIVRVLRRAGAVLLPGEKPEEALERAAMFARIDKADRDRPTAPMPAMAAFNGDTLRGGRQAPVAGGVAQVMDPDPEEQASLDEANDLTDEERRRILGALRLADTGDPWLLLGVARGTDKRTLKRAFFERSKTFHPDRYYGRRLGSFAGRLHAVFEAITRAHADLTGGRASTAVEQVEPSAPQTPAEYALELFERACEAELASDAEKALKLFAAAIKLDPQPRFLRRAATCALTAGDLYTALDHAQKAAKSGPPDPSVARVLAKILRGLGRAGEAEEVLVMALAMRTDNDTLVTELTADLRSLRNAMDR
jgi:tetratricopeptide (TPR) repeat protein